MSSSESVPVAIVGGGPVGLSLALGLARAGVRSVLLERKPTTHEHSRAPAIHVRTREIFRQWGIERTLLEAGTLVQQITLHTVEPGRPPRFTLDFRELDAEADAPGILILEQSHTERLLRAAVQESGYCDLRFGCEAVGLAFHDRGARVEYRAGGDTEQVSAQFVAGCDGASSFVRHALQLPFPGITYSLRPMLADVRIDDARDTLPWPRMRNAADGLTVGLRLAPSLWRLIRLEPGKPSQSDEVPEPELRARVDDVLGPGAFQPVWASRFRIHRRASPRFVVGCVLLAGDAAHVHSPVGGLGMNGGIQDAANLAWKLAAALDDGDSERLLASYETERRAVVVEKVSRYTDLLTRLFLQAPSALREATLGLFGTALRNRWIQRANLRDIGMIGFDYPASPVLN
ncbi:MAG TPA: FAD-dependent monooxygenase, partial [Burkholderiaceae bacterium]|nr:FAD-dependent monooxygenase [Burkholderiaceae bacterium]